MKTRKHRFIIPLILVIGISVVTVGITPTTAHPQTTIRFSPKDTSVMPCPEREFTVNITVSDVESLNLYQVGLTFDPAILEATSFVAGDFFLQAPEEYRTEFVNQPFGEDNIDSARGICHAIAWALRLPGNVSGTGTLAVVTFKVVALGVSPLIITMSGSEAATLGDVDLNPIPFGEIEEGSVTVSLGYPGYVDHSVVWDDVTYHVGTFSNSCVSDFTFSQPDKNISFNLTAPLHPNNWPAPPAGWCNVTIPKQLLSGSWVVLQDGTNITDTITTTENGTHTSIYFNYTHKSEGEPSAVDITGTIVIPEFPAAMLLLLFMIATLLVVTLRKINQPKRRKTLPGEIGFS